VYWVDRGIQPGSDDRAWETAAIDQLVLRAQRQLRLAEGEDSLDAMAAALGGMQLSAPFAAGFIRYRAPMDAPSLRATQSPLPALRRFQWLHSFSGLTRHAAAAVTIDDSGSADETGFGEPADDNATQPVELAEDSRLLALYPLRGPRFGDAVHHVLELARPGPVWPEQRQLLHNQLAAQAIKSNTLPADDMLGRVGRMIDRARQADLGDGLRLIDIPTDRRIVEFEFQFPVRQAPLARLRQLCIAHGQHDVVPASLDATTLNGMLTGFADLIVEWDGRFHVLDYKTNWLGARLQDYRDNSLDMAMSEHHYPLQALLYTVALHRYLRHRMDGYTAEHKLGDSLYLFVRALGLEPDVQPPPGVWRHRWPAALIESLDDAFAGAQEAAA
jgi:exodeoxyribonuclease V beta subunit